MNRQIEEAIDMLRDITVARIRIMKDIEHIKSNPRMSEDYKDKLLGGYYKTHYEFGTLRDTILENIMSWDYKDER